MPKKTKKVMREANAKIEEGVTEIANALAGSPRIMPCSLEEWDAMTEAERDAKTDLIMETAQATGWGLMARMFEKANEGEWLSTIKTMNDLYEFFQGLAAWVDARAKESGQLRPVIEKDGDCEFGVAIMECGPDGEVRQVDLTALPSDVRAGLEAQIEALKEQAKADHDDSGVVVARGDGGYL